jgi:uncharacterized protein
VALSPAVLRTIEHLLRERLGDWPAEWEGYHWPGYTYEHTLRVRNLALELARREGADEQVVHLAALLHDIRKDSGRDHAHVGAEEARGILLDAGVNGDLNRRVCAAIASHAGENRADSPMENLCLGDADLIDANFGLVGTWRFITIRSGHDTPINETVRSMGAWLPQKDSLLGLLLTRSGREIARQRAARAWVFWEELRNEWETDPQNGEYRLTDFVRQIHDARGGSYLEQQVCEVESVSRERHYLPIVPVICRSLRGEIAGLH